MVNYSTAVKKRGDDIIFLRKITKGSADRSYGVEVALLAGVPESVIRRAKEILNGIEQENGQVVVKPSVVTSSKAPISGQMSLMSVASPVEEKLKELDINTITPIEAMGILYDLKKLL